MSVTLFISLIVVILILSAGSTFVAFKLFNATKIPPKKNDWQKDEPLDDWDKDDWKNS